LSCFLISSCEITDKSEADLLIERIMSGIETIEKNYIDCLALVSKDAVRSQPCENNRSIIRVKYTGVSGSLSNLASLRDSGVISNDEYEKYVSVIDGKLTKVRELSGQLREKGIDFKFGD